MHTDDIDGILKLGKLAMRYATVKRVTFLEDGETPESDTDHTVMMGLVCVAVAARFDPTLNTGLVAQYALIHDLVEAYAGDTNTFGGLSTDAHVEKEAREAAALARIDQELSSTLPWIASTIHSYESLNDRESRFVRTMDKIMPKITRLINERHHTSAADFDAHCKIQYAKLKETYGHDQPIALTIYDAMTARASALLHAHENGTAH